MSSAKKFTITLLVLMLAVGASAAIMRYGPELLPSVSSSISSEETSLSSEEESSSEELTSEEVSSEEVISSEEVSSEEISSESGMVYTILNITDTTPLSTPITLKESTYGILGIDGDIAVLSFPSFGIYSLAFDPQSTYVPIDPVPGIEYMTGNDLDIYGYQSGTFMRLMTLEIETGYFLWRASGTSYTNTIVVLPTYFSISSLSI